MKKVVDFAISKAERLFNPDVTLAQIKLPNYFVFGSWGAHEFVNVSNKALIFKVNGYLHKGYVCITLGFLDTYNIYLLDFDGKLLEEKSDVYCDEIQMVIDSIVEQD